jgi:hypothetical protein
MPRPRIAMRKTREILRLTLGEELSRRHAQLLWLEYRELYHVVVDVHPGLMPGRELITGGRRRPQRRAVDLLEQRLAAAVELLERPGVDLGDAGGDRGVRLGQRAEPAVAQPSSASRRPPPAWRPCADWATRTSLRRC